MDLFAVTCGTLKQAYIKKEPAYIIEYWFCFYNEWIVPLTLFPLTLTPPLRPPPRAPGAGTPSWTPVRQDTSQSTRGAKCFLAYVLIFHVGLARQCLYTDTFFFSSSLFFFFKCVCPFLVQPERQQLSGPGVLSAGRVQVNLVTNFFLSWLHLWLQKYPSSASLFRSPPRMVPVRHM